MGSSEDPVEGAPLHAATPGTHAMTVVLATHNRGKIQELRALLAALPVEVLSIVDVLPQHPMPIEHGATFQENAFLKARDAAVVTGLVAIADDSGLEVDALGGRPGVRSARFARDGATDAENNAALLAAMQEIDGASRTARFRCSIAVVDPYVDLDKPAYFEGRCEGLIARTSRGESGFGYDPLFVVAASERTFAELSDDEKNVLSHRGQATRLLVPHLRSLVEAREAEATRILGRSR